MQEPDEVAEQAVLLQLLAHDYFALVDLGVEKLFSERGQHDVAVRSRDEAEDFRRLHHLEQVAEFEIQIARDFVAIFAAAAILEQFEQAEDPRQADVGERMYDRRRHQARSSISERTLSVKLLKTSVRRSRGRGNSTRRSATIRPGPDASTMIRSASSIASSMMWVTSTIFFTGMSGDCQMSSNSSRSVIAVRASSAENGSSIRSTLGSTASARANPTRCFIPPESSRGYASSKPSRPTLSIYTPARFSRCSSGSPRASRPSSTLSLTESHGSSAKDWNTSAHSRLIPSTWRPRYKTCPELRGTIPLMMRSKVDLPHPEGPTIAMNSPSSTLKVMSPSTCKVPLA